MTEDAARELASIYRSDLTLILSDYEKALLQDRFQIPETLLHLCSLFHEITSDSTSRPEPESDFGRKKNFVSLGGFRHPPNCDSVVWLKQTIWPAIRASLPEAELHIYGSYPSRAMTDLSDASQGIWVKGEVRAAIETLSNYRVMLAPLRFGAGIKGKILDMWASGGCVITTDIGAEGMKLEQNTFAGMIHNDAETFAEAAVELYQDSSQWKTLSERGAQTLEEKFSAKKQSAALLSRLLEVRSCLRERRLSNHVGYILWHHTLRSTEYFSRWIETKNRLAPPLQP
jgi:glycosyltransferase involved in cell wall biosynthesis